MALRSRSSGTGDDSAEGPHPPRAGSAPPSPSGPSGEGRFRALFHAIPRPVYAWTLAGGGEFRLTDVNTAARQATDGRVAEWVGSTAREMYPDRPDILADFARCARNRAPFTREMSYRFRTTGLVRTLQVTYAPVRPDLILVLIDDVTDRVHLESALAGSINAVVLVGPDETVSYVNRAFLTMWGYESETEVVGIHARHLASDGEGYAGVIAALRKHGRWVGEVRPRRTDGSTFAAQLVAHVLDADTGAGGTLMGAFLDLRELKASRREEAGQRRILEAVLDTLTDGVVMADTTGQIRLWNRAAEAVFGGMRGVPITGAAPGVSLFRTDRRTPLPVGERPLVRAVGGETTRNQELFARTPSHPGGIDLSASGSPVRDQQGRLLGGLTVFRDLSGRRRAANALRESRDALRNLAGRLQAVREEERSAVAREIHDELGQTLTCLKMDLAWVRERVGPSDPVRDRLDAMGVQVSGALRTARELSWRLRPAILDDLGLGPAIEWLVGDLARRTGIRWELRLPAELPELDRDSATAAFRILQESVTNVLRHAGAGQVRVTATVTRTALTLGVLDDGRGIDETEVSDGQSLGLIGMRERAHVVGGRFEIGPAWPHGTLATLELPLQADEAEEPM